MKINKHALNILAGTNYHIKTEGSFINIFLTDKNAVIKLVLQKVEGKYVASEPSIFRYADEILPITILSYVERKQDKLKVY